MSIQFSRGCPYNCEFCNVPPVRRRPRTKSAEQIIAELNDVYELGCAGRSLVDDNLIGNRKDSRRTSAADRVAQRPARLHIQHAVSINLADDEQLMGMMADAGFDTVFIALKAETTPGRVQQVQNKNPTCGRLKRIQRAGCRCRADSSSASTAIAVDLSTAIDFIQTSAS